jgi:hypothetical protein
MSSVAMSPHEQGQLANVRSHLWIINNIRPSTLLSPALRPNLIRTAKSIIPSTLCVMKLPSLLPF